MNYPTDENEMTEPTISIVDVHDDCQLVSVPLQLNPPVFSRGKVIKLHDDKILRSANGSFYFIGNKKNMVVKFGSIYEGRELIYNEELKTFRLKNENAQFPDLHIQIVNHHKYWADKRSDQHPNPCDDIMDELSILQYIQQFPQHPNIARLVDCLQDENFIYSVMEYGGDDLFNIIKLSGGLFTENHKIFPGGLYTEAHRRHIFSQILDGVEFLQSIGIYHRDISVDNLLFNPFTGIVKIIDFGMALHIPRMQMSDIADHMLDLNMQEVNHYPAMYPIPTMDSDTPPPPPLTLSESTAKEAPSSCPDKQVEEELIPLLILNQGWYGKRAYAPPEMYAAQPLNGFLADNWSLGVVLYHLLTGVAPWKTPELGVDNYFHAIIVDDSLLATLSVTSISGPAKDLLRRMLRSVSPRDRLRIKEMRAHPWMTMTTYE